MRQVASPGTGRTAAGCLIMARRTGRFLFCLRSRSVPSGGTWSLWGGKTEEGETPIETAIREVGEETGVVAPETPAHIHRLVSGSFTYDTFIMIVEDEFRPASCAEVAGYAWLPVEDLPSPIHWGLDRLLADSAAVARIVRMVETTSGRICLLRPRKAALPGKGGGRSWRSRGGELRESRVSERAS